MGESNLCIAATRASFRRLSAFGTSAGLSIQGECRATQFHRAADLPRRWLGCSARRFLGCRFLGHLTLRLLTHPHPLPGRALDLEESDSGHQIDQLGVAPVAGVESRLLLGDIACDAAEVGPTVVV